MNEQNRKGNVQIYKAASVSKASICKICAPILFKTLILYKQLLLQDPNWKFYSLFPRYILVMNSCLGIKMGKQIAQIHSKYVTNSETENFGVPPDLN